MADAKGSATFARRWGWLKQQFLRSDLGASLRNMGGGERLMPQYLIVGTQKAGTTFLHALLGNHPEILKPIYKELHYFDLYSWHSKRWYQSFFLQKGTSPTGNPYVTGDSTPEYMFHPLGPERMAKMLPDAKIIAILRDPTARALSHHQMSIWLQHETLPFKEALAKEDQRLAGELDQILANPRYRGKAYWRHSYRTRGLYLEQIKRLEQHFPKENILVLDSTELFKQTDDALAKVEPFIGISDWKPEKYEVKNQAKVKKAVDEETLAELRDFYRPLNAELFDHLGWSPRWG